MADVPNVTDATLVYGSQNTTGLVITPNEADKDQVTHFKITAIQNGKLYLNDATTPVADGSFITVAEGQAGLKFALDVAEVGSFDVQASVGATADGLGGDKVTATINFELAPVVTGTEELAVGVNVYPNPASNQVAIELNNVAWYGSTIILADPLGSEVMRTSAIARTTYIDLSQQASGLYVVVVQGAKQTQTFKVLKR